MELMASASGKNKRSAVPILEETVHFLRLAPASLFLCYYTGSLPFVLGVLFFWADMSRNAFAGDYLAVASLGVALLFCWMKIWHAVFAQRVLAMLAAVPPRPWSFQRLTSAAGILTLIHSTGFIVLPLAAVLMLPFGWCYAFYQNVSVQCISDSDNLRTVCSNAWQHAKLWPWQNHILISVFALFGMMIFLNLAVITFIIPYIFKKFAGIESIYTMSGFHALNTTFLATVAGLSYLCMDPLVKTAYALRCFYGEAVKSGADLKAELNHFASGRKKLAAVMIAFLLLSPVQARGAETAGLSLTQQTAISPQQLDSSIDEVIQRREYAWRLPRESKGDREKKQTGAVAQVLKWVADKLKGAFETLAQWIKKLEALLNKLLPSPDPGKSSSAADWRQTLRYLLVAAVIIFLIVLCVYSAKALRRRRKPADEIESRPVVHKPDLNDDDIRADEIPVNQWLQLARELMTKGSLRLAMRALYLASLAYLAEKDLLAIELYKSNRDYERELLRRAHDKNDLLRAFSETVATFECVWYGMYEIGPGDVAQYLKDQERIMSLAG